MTKKTKRSGFILPRYKPEVWEAMRESGRYGGGATARSILPRGADDQGQDQSPLPARCRSSPQLLKNRQPKKWRDKTEQVVSTPDSSKPLGVIYLHGKPEEPKDEG
jgi:hypothetical protein